MFTLKMAASFFGVELNTNLYFSNGSMLVASCGGITVTLPLGLPLCRIEVAEQFGGDCSDSYGGSDVVISVCISCRSMYRTGGTDTRCVGGGGAGDVVAVVVDAVDNGLPFKPARFLEWFRSRIMIHMNSTIHSTDNIKPITMAAKNTKENISVHTL